MPLNISGSIVNATMADTLDTEGVIKRGLRVHLDPDSLGTASGESIAGDISGNNNNSTVAHMKTGTAVSFDETNDYISISIFVYNLININRTRS